MQPEQDSSALENLFEFLILFTTFGLATTAMLLIMFSTKLLPLAFWAFAAIMVTGCAVAASRTGFNPTEPQKR